MSDLTGAKTALLLVHLQNDIVAPGTAFGSLFAAEAEARGVIAKANAAAKSVRDAGGLVVRLRIAFAEDYSDLAPTIPLLAMVVQAGCLKDGSEGAELVAGLETDETDVVLTHQRPGPFTGSGLEELLRERGIESVFVGGVATNASVEGVVRQAADLGFRTYLLADAASAADGAAHDAAVASMGLFATVTTVDGLVFD